MSYPEAQVQWPEYVRLINSAYPPIDVFEDIAGPEDWLLLGSVESKTNQRVMQSLGDLDLVPAERRVGGLGSSYVMAPFTHISPDRGGRFHDGTFGAFYAARSFQTAVFEVMHHFAKVYRDTAQEPGWPTDFRELKGSVDATFTDIRMGFPELLDPESYVASQAFAREVREKGANGIVYPSVRDPDGECFAAFHPDVISIPRQGRHVRCHWNGTRIDMIRDLGTNEVFQLTP